MKRSWMIFLAAGLLLACAFPAFANEHGMMEQGMMNQEEGSRMMKKKMMGMMHKDSLVATSDGGVVLMQGPRLLKYDSNLSLVAEVEIPRGKKPGESEEEEAMEQE